MTGQNAPADEAGRPTQSHASPIVAGPEPTNQTKPNQTKPNHTDTACASIPDVGRSWRRTRAAVRNTAFEARRRDMLEALDADAEARDRDAFARFMAERNAAATGGHDWN